jgi:hypothetical protein
MFADVSEVYAVSLLIPEEACILTPSSLNTKEACSFAASIISARLHGVTPQKEIITIVNVRIPNVINF